MTSEQVVREQLLVLLEGGNAHMEFTQAVEKFPPQLMNARAPNVAYTAWQLLEHMRRAQIDVLQFIRDPNYVSPKWPEGYWPAEGEQADQARWDKSVRAFEADHQAFEELVRDPGTDLFGPIPHAPEYTVLREVLVISDHNAYHMGEMGLMRQVLGAWPAEHDSR